MKVTYIFHSGFLIETEERYLLFDYYKGTIPTLDTEKPLYVFASHKHGDHFNTKIFELAQRNPKVTFILSYDIKMKSWNKARWNITEGIAERIISVKANETYNVADMELTTLKSTDEGVAFLLTTEEKTIYHAGDLNWWYWEGESKQSNNNMTANFKREIDKLTDVSIDIAFIPLDPRQEAQYYLGLDYIIKKAKIQAVFPMHMWEDYSVISKFKEEGYLSESHTIIMEIKESGQDWVL